VLPFIGIASGASCGSSFSAGSGDDGGPSDGTAPQGDSSGGPADTGGDRGSDGSATGLIVYVAPSGNDANTGLSQSTPKRSIASAVAYATGSLPPGAQVHVCAGTYAETGLTVQKDVALSGGYDCGTWKRTATYGFPKFDGANQTIVTNASPSTQAATLVVGGSVTAATVIDGLAVTGASSLAATTVGIDVNDQAAPVLSNDVISGGGGTADASNIGSIGVRITGSSSPQVAFCQIGGGGGSGAIGSEGVHVQTTGAPSLHDDVVSGGTGVPIAASGGAAIGISLASSVGDASPLRGLLVAGSDSVGVPGNTAGIAVDKSVDATIVGCDVEGGYGTVPATSSVGIEVNAGGNVRILQDRIYGGKRTGATATTIGVLVSGTTSLQVVNSEIHAGTVPNSTGSQAVGIVLASTAAPTLAFDTVYLGASAGTAVALNAGVSAASLVDDLLIGSESTLGNYGIGAAACAGLVGTVESVAFVNVGDVYACGTGTVASDPSVLAQDLTAATVKGDIELQATCPAAAWCVPSPLCPNSPPGPCLTSLFGSSWSKSDDGVGSLLLGTTADGGTTAGGWTLAPLSPCRLTAGGVPVTGVTKDLFGNPRSGATPTIGAVEYTGTCQ
jgi:hypothetical protein